MKAGKINYHRDWDNEGAIVMENATTIERYKELRELQPSDTDCAIFFAFSNQQYEDGLSKLKALGKISDGDTILSTSIGAYGTREGLQAFFDFYENVDKVIANECDPQEVYFYEYNNHECMFAGDSDAYNCVRCIFGEERMILYSW